MLITYKQADNLNNKHRNLKAKIYYLVLRTILKRMYPTHYLKYQYKVTQVIKIALKEYYDDSIEMICANGLKRRCYPVLIGVMIDYKK